MNEKLEILMPVHNEAKAISKIIPNIHKNIGDKIEYSFIIVPIKENDKLKPSNILRLIPNENVTLEYAN